MDSSSDNDEFYECDDDVDEDKKIIEDRKGSDKHKQIIPDVELTKGLDSLTTTPIDSIRKTEQITEDNKSKVEEETCNNNPQIKNLQDNIIVDKTITSTLPVNIGKPKVASHNNNSNKQSANEELISNKSTVVEKLANDQNLAIDKLCTSIERECSINDDGKKVFSCDTSKKIISKGPTNTEEAQNDNIWDDNDWGDFGQSSNEGTTPCKETEIQKVVAQEKENKPIDKMPINSSVQKIQKEENLWEDEDDWGKLETEAKVEPEEDLWGEGDGWGIETPQETPKNESKYTSSTKDKPLKESESRKTEENDLWAEGDNWGINDTADDSKTNPKSALDAIASKDTWGGWSNWGISSVLSTAANITTSVSQGITTVLESGIGVPDPEELARLHKAEAEQRSLKGEEPLPEHGEQPVEDFVPFGLGNLVPGVSKITKLVETTGTKVISKGLGTLETIGKKTYEVLQENDPQLKKKRALLKLLEADKPVLSSILREAKERAETENKDREMRHFAKKANYETMFDDYTGLVHLEALEMLSKQCDIKLESIMGQSLDVGEIQETMEQIKDLCELTTDDDDEDITFDELKSKMEEAINEINIGITCEKVLEVFIEVTNWIEHTDSCNKDEIHSNAIENLAKLTAMAVEQYHKAGELLLIKEHRSTADEADSLVQLTTSISSLISLMSTKYTEKLKTCSETSNEELKTLISNIYLEAANSSRYVEDAFGLLIPVIQVGAV